MKAKFSSILTLLLAFVVQISFAQQQTITGTVTDQDDLPLPGVNIVVKGTSNGVQTDFDGNYSISAAQGDVLVYSFIGLKKAEYTVGSENTINVVMEQDAAQLEEVVVTALGIKRKQDEITTANQVVDEEELTQAQNPNVVQGLAGKVSGLQINTTSSGVNQDVRINLRGNRSLTGDNEALIVIDGVISTSQVLTSLDPNLIESVNVIKGANGAALYGSRGSNGVFMVTTKKGAETDKLTVTVNSAASFEDIAYLPERQLRYGQGWNGEFVNYENGGWGPEFDGSLQPVGLPQEDGTFKMFPFSPIEDNIGQFFSTGTTLQNTVSLSTGNLEEGYVFFSANKTDIEFVIKDDVADRNTFNFKGGKKIGKWTLEGNASYITSKTEQSTGALYTALLQTATNIPVGEFDSGRMTDHWTSYYRSPYWIRDNERTTDRYDIFNGIANVAYEFNDNISASYAANIRTRQRNGLSFVNGYTDNANIGGGDFTTISSFDSYADTQRNYYGDLLINFDYEVGNDFTVKANIGNNIQDNLFQQSTNGGDNLTIPGFYNVDNVTGTPRVSNTVLRSRRIGVFGNLDIGYKDFLFLNATARNDWTSTLDESNNSFFYPSAGLSFIATKAIPGLKGDILNYAKFSASYVKVGNDGGIGAYETVPVFQQAANFPYGSLNSFVQDVSITNPLLEPEFVTSREFNANLGFFDNRITLDGSYYFSSNTNQIANTSSSYASGITSSRVNIGETETKGFEIDLGITPIKTEDFRWDARFSYATNETEVIKISDDTDEIALQSFPDNPNPVGIFAIVGEEFPTIKGTKYLRDPQGRVIVDPNTGTPQVSSDLEVLGKSNPDYILGLNTSVQYKGLRLAGVFDYRTGHQFWSGSKSWLTWSGHLIESAANGRGGFIYPNSSVETSPGSGVYEANTSVITGGTSYSNYLNYYSNDVYTVTENYVLDATAFKVRELSLTYSLPSRFLEPMSLSSLSVGVNARNPFIALPKENRGYNDPETSNTTGNGQGLAEYQPVPCY